MCFLDFYVALKPVILKISFYVRTFCSLIRNKVFQKHKVDDISQDFLNLVFFINAEVKFRLCDFINERQRFQCLFWGKTEGALISNLMFFIN